jgi:hypothetical protein
MPPATAIRTGAFRNCASLSCPSSFPLTSLLSLEPDAFEGCSSLLPPALAKRGADPALVRACLSAKARPFYRYALLLCARRGGAEKEAGRGASLSPLLSRFSALPADVLREHVVPFVVGTEKTEDDAMALLIMGADAMGREQYNEAMVAYRKR